VFTERALRGEGLAYAVIVEPMDLDVDQVRLDARARLAGVFAGLIEEGIAAGELPEQDARLGGAAIVGRSLRAWSPRWPAAARTRATASPSRGCRDPLAAGTA
jgi:hypothetical protein